MEFLHKPVFGRAVFIAGFAMAATAWGTLPAAWFSKDIGTVQATGSATYSGGTFTITGSGADIYNNSDEFRFVYVQLDGDGEIRAKVRSIQNTHEWAKAGVMIRETLASNSKHAMMFMAAGTGRGLKYRASTGGITDFIPSSQASTPGWIKLRRAGNTFTAYASADGVSWSPSGTINIAMAAKVYMGFAVTSHNDGTLAQAEFSDAVLQPEPVPPNPLPAPWLNRDIGYVLALGRASHSAGEYTLTGSGKDIWETADGFHFAYQTLVGDGEIKAKVESIENTDNWAKAGVMIRDGLDAKARFAMTVVTPSRGLVFQYRESVGANAASDPGVSGAAPRWVKIRRTGNIFASYVSPDGVAWTQISTRTIAMGSATRIGLLVTGHENGVLCQARFTNVTVHPPMSPPAFTTQPISQNLYSGQTAYFRVAVSGPPDITYQWQKNGVDILDATNPYYHTPQVTMSDSGSVFTCVAANSAGSVSSQPAALTVTSGEVGRIQREYWLGVPGHDLASLLSNPAYPDHPSGQDFLSLLEAPKNWKDNYGTRLRGYVVPPASGAYSFYIAGDDQSQLLLSTDADPAKKVLIARVPGWTAYREWNKFPEQASAPKTLEAGKKYYIEVLHKEGEQDDNLSVGWRGPGISGDAEKPIPGSRLIPFHAMGKPEILTQPASASVIMGSRAEFSIMADGKPALHYQWRKNGVSISGATGPLYRTPPATAEDAGARYVCVVKNDYGTTVSAEAILTVTGLPTGRPVIERWEGIPGKFISNLLAAPAYPRTPSSVAQLGSLLETPRDAGDNYGVRIRAYIVPPATGAFTFHISGDDQSQFFLSGGEDPAGATLIAHVTGYTGPREWGKYPEQTSAPVELVQGRRYYLEVLQKENLGFDNLAVGWTGPGIDGSSEKPIPTTRLVPFDPTVKAKALLAKTAGLYNTLDLANTEISTSEGMIYLSKPVLASLKSVGSGPIWSDAKTTVMTRGRVQHCRLPGTKETGFEFADGLDTRGQILEFDQVAYVGTAMRNSSLHHLVSVEDFQAPWFLLALFPEEKYSRGSALLWIEAASGRIAKLELTTHDPDFESPIAEGGSETQVIGTETYDIDIGPCRTSVPSAPSGGFRYLRFTSTANGGGELLALSEIEWLVGGVAHPIAKMSGNQDPAPLRAIPNFEIGAGTPANAWRLYDGNLRGEDLPASLGIGKVIYSLDLGAGNGILPDQARITGASDSRRSPTSFRLEASEDDLSWVTVLSAEGVQWAVAETKTFDLMPDLLAGRCVPQSLTIGIRGLLSRMPADEIDYFRNFGFHPGGNGRTATLAAYQGYVASIPTGSQEQKIMAKAGAMDFRLNVIDTYDLRYRIKEALANGQSGLQVNFTHVSMPATERAEDFFVADPIPEEFK